MYGFDGESKAKYDLKVTDLFYQLFQLFPLAHVINKKVMITHGGLFNQDGVTLKDIEKIDRKKEIPESGLMCDLMWSDPCDMNGRHISKRGCGTMFGPDITAKFLD